MLQYDYKKVLVKSAITFLMQFLCTGLFAQKNDCPVITGFRVLNKDFPVDSVLRQKTIELSHDQSSFTISFASADPAGNHPIYYMLDGADKNWIRAGKSATINYTLLPPGLYVFKLKCGEQKEEIKLNILIKVPVWLNSWFIILSCTAFVGALYLLHRLSVKRLLAIEAIRQKVSRDLHDDIGSALSTINILSTMAKSKIAEDPVKASEYLSKISDNSSRMMEAMDDIVWSINPMNDSMRKIFARMREFATEVLEARDVILYFQFDENAFDLSLTMEQRRDIFLIFKEAINNIAKYAHASEVIIEVLLKNNTLTLTIKDNGTGFDVKNADSGNGLNNMQKRAEKLNAKFNISSEPKKGTTLSVEVQIA